MEKLGRARHRAGNSIFDSFEPRRESFLTDLYAHDSLNLEKSNKLIQINIFTLVIVKDNTIYETWGITTTAINVSKKLKSCVEVSIHTY